MNIIVRRFKTCTEIYYDCNAEKDNGNDNKDDCDGKSDDDEYNGIHKKDDGDDEEDDALTSAQVTSIDRH